MIRIRQAGLLGGIAFGVAVSGCNSFDDEPPPQSTEPRLVIPVDERAASTSVVRPKAVSGGTLTVLKDGSAVVVSDPERDLVSVVDLETLAVRHTIRLEAGDEPGRSIEDADQHVHVALRSGGAVVSFDPRSGAVVERRAVCKAPRGMAFEGSTDLLHVACTEGKLVSLPAKGGVAVRTLAVENDVRDVVVRGSELWLTRFKSAQVLRVSAAGEVVSRIAIPPSAGQIFNATTSEAKGVTMEAGVAWRAQANAGGGVTVVHQQTVADEIEITPPSQGGSAYGGGGFGLGCGGIVRNVVSTIAADGSVVSTTLQGSPLPVDVALSPDQSWVAVAHAGPADFDAPRPFLVFPDSQGGQSAPTAGPSGGGFGGPSLSIVPASAVNQPSDCMFSQGSAVGPAPVTAVAFTANGRLLAQTEEPAQLLVITELPFGAPVTIALPGESRTDTGHDVFHRDAGGGIACASCHPEGGEDGRTWRFADTGDRRTQPLHVGLRDTAPFHWAGDLPDVGAVMSEVFVGRMGGVKQAPDRLSALSEWIFSLTPPPAIRDSADPAALRGQELFNSSSVGCASCHSGAKLTDNKSVAIDSLVQPKLQVPSLVAVGYRAPFMHTGCAATLAARFDPACGGNAHGNTADLSAAQVDDMVAYLESL